MSFVIEQRAAGPTLVVTGRWSAQARNALLDGRADGLVLNYALGFVQEPIDFIEGLPIKRLEILARSIDDLTPVYSLAATLEELSVDCDPRVPIELENLPALKTVAADWPQIRASALFAPQLECVRTSSYTEPDLSPLSSMTSLTSLTMKDCPGLRSLDGMDAFPWLVTLYIALARNLDDITAIARHAPLALQELRFPACKRIPDIEPVAACPGLTFFELSEGGRIPSVAPLTGLDRLEYLWLFDSTYVVGGDLRPLSHLSHLKDFRMMNRSHYRPRVREIQDAIGFVP